MSALEIKRNIKRVSRTVAELLPPLIIGMMAPPFSLSLERSRNRDVGRKSGRGGYKSASHCVLPIAQHRTAVLTRQLVVAESAWAIADLQIRQYCVVITQVWNASRGLDPDSVS